MTQFNGRHWGRVSGIILFCCALQLGCSKERPRLEADVRVQAKKDAEWTPPKAKDVAAVERPGAERALPIELVYGTKVRVQSVHKDKTATWVQLPNREAPTGCKLVLNGPPDARWTFALFTNPEDEQPTQVFEQDVPGHPIVVTGLAIGPKFGAPLLKISSAWSQNPQKEVHAGLIVLAQKRGKGQEVEPQNGGPDHAVLLHHRVGASGVLSHSYDRDCVRMDPPEQGCWAAHLLVHRHGRRGIRVQAYDKMGKMTEALEPTSDRRDDVIRISTHRTRGFCLSMEKIGKVGVEWYAKWDKISCDTAPDREKERWLNEPEERLVPFLVRAGENQLLHRTIAPEADRDRLMLAASEYPIYISISGPVTTQWSSKPPVPQLLGPGQHATVTARPARPGSNQSTRYTVHSRILNQPPFQRPSSSPVEISAKGAQTFIPSNGSLTVLLPTMEQAPTRWKITHLALRSKAQIQVRALDSEGRAVTMRNLKPKDTASIPTPAEYGPYRLEFTHKTPSEAEQWVSITPVANDEGAGTP